MTHHLDDYGVGSIAEIFEGDPPFAPSGCIAKAGSVAETLGTWLQIEDTRAGERRPPSALRGGRRPRRQAES